MAGGDSFSCDQDVLSRIDTPEHFSTWQRAKDTALTSATSSTLPAIEQEIFKTLNCVQGKITILTNLSTNDANTQTTIAYLDKEIAKENELAAIAKERLKHIKNPGIVSYYQSWFPLERPLRSQTIPVLIGISVFVSLMAFAYLLATVNIYIFIRHISASSLEEELAKLGLLGVFQFVMTQFTMSFWLVVAALIAVILYYYYNK